MFVIEREAQQLISELHIQNARLGDSGLYSCSAVKIDGETGVKSVRLTVKGEYNWFPAEYSKIVTLTVCFVTE